MVRPTIAAGGGRAHWSGSGHQKIQAGRHSGQPGKRPRSGTGHWCMGLWGTKRWVGFIQEMEGCIPGFIPDVTVF